MLVTAGDIRTNTFMESYTWTHQVSSSSNDSCQLCVDTACSLEDQQWVMDDWDRWQERVCDICAINTTWRWWWWLNPYPMEISTLVCSLCDCTLCEAKDDSNSEMIKWLWTSIFVCFLHTQYLQIFYWIKFLEENILLILYRHTDSLSLQSNIYEEPLL